MQNFIDMTGGKIISENIKKLHIKLSLTHNDSAEKADIKSTTLTKVESVVVNRSIV